MVSPNSARMTTLRLRHWPNDSVSGAFEVLPSSFIFLKAGDSFIDKRIHTLTPSRKIDTRNGMRPPQPLNAASPIHVRVARMTSSDRNRPSVAVVWIHDVYAPRLPCGECS